MGIVLTGSALHLALLGLGFVLSPHYWVPVGFLKLGVSKMECSLTSGFVFIVRSTCDASLQ